MAKISKNKKKKVVKKTTKSTKSKISRVRGKAANRKINRRSATARASRIKVSKAKVVAPTGRSKKPLANLQASPLKAGKQQDKVNALITLGRERGYITYDEIMREFPTIEENVDLLESMYERFSTAGIDVLEGGGMLEETSADSAGERPRQAYPRRRRRSPRHPRSVQPPPRRLDRQEIRES